jgi:hypothetical protein
MVDNTHPLEKAQSIVLNVRLSLYNIPAREVDRKMESRGNVCLLRHKLPLKES